MVLKSRFTTRRFNYVCRSVMPIMQFLGQFVLHCNAFYGIQDKECLFLVVCGASLVQIYEKNYHFEKIQSKNNTVVWVLNKMLYFNFSQFKINLNVYFVCIKMTCCLIFLKFFHSYLKTFRLSTSNCWQRWILITRF